jgi:hypothetical protein
MSGVVRQMFSGHCVPFSVLIQEVLFLHMEPSGGRWGFMDCGGKESPLACGQHRGAGREQSLMIVPAELMDTQMCQEENDRSTDDW